MNLFEETYDGELNFDIENVDITQDSMTFDIMAEYKEEKVGMQVCVPILTKKILFKSFAMVSPSRPMIFRSVGEASDQLIHALDEIWAPDFEVSNGFSGQDVEIEFVVQNKDPFDCTAEKTYTKIFTSIDMQTGDPFDNINVELYFNFNLGRKRASIIEKKKHLRNDFLAMIMA